MFTAAHFNSHLVWKAKQHEYDTPPTFSFLSLFSYIAILLLSLLAIYLFIFHLDWPQLL